MQTIQPTQNNEREIFLDALRGFAILGIFIANLAGFSEFNGDAKITSPWILEGWDDVMEFFHAMLIEGKFYSIFSLLFGWGIALQLKRSSEMGVNSISTIRRRLLFMLLLGAFHLLIWIGDIVFFYALVGFLLLPFRKFSNKTLLITATVLVLSPILLYWLKMTYPVLNSPAEILFHTGNQLEGKFLGINSEAAFQNYIKDANWFDVAKLNVCGFFYRYGHLIFVSRIPKVLGMFLIGYVIGRTDFYKNLKQNKKIVYWVIGLGLLIGLPANFILAQYMSSPDTGYYRLKINGWYQTIAYAFGVAPLALAYVGLMMLSFQTAIGHKIMGVISPVGKMAFSNYIMHSLIGNFVFLSIGLNYGGKVGPVYYTLFAIAVWIAQIIISTIWLKYFNFGPVEWVWRSLTYGKRQPMLK
jgi:uncharacterized protein